MMDAFPPALRQALSILAVFVLFTLVAGASGIALR